MTKKHPFRISFFGMEQYFRLIKCTQKDDGGVDHEAARKLAVNFVRLMRYYSPKGDGYHLTERSYLCRLYSDEVCPFIDLNIRGVEFDLDITETSEYDDFLREIHPEIKERWKDHDLRRI